MQQLVKSTPEEELHHQNNGEESMEINAKLVANSHKNKLVVCSIHQPSSEVFACFSHVILMQEGRIAFQGTVVEAEEFFLGYKCKLYVFFTL